LRAFGAKKRLGHQQADAVLLPGHRREQNSGRARAGRKRIDGRPQTELHLLAVKMLFEYLELAAHPRLPDRAIERSDNVDDEALYSQAQQETRQRRVEPDCIVPLEQREDVALDDGGGSFASRANAPFRERIELVERLPHELPGPQARVHQSLDRAQPRELVAGILAFGVLVATRTRKAIAALPDAQHVFRQPCLALDRADVEAC